MEARGSLKVVLVRPPVETLHKFSKPVECLALGYLASALRESGHSVELVDAMLLDWTNERTADEILRRAPDVVGFTVVLNHFPDLLGALVRQVRDRGFAGLIMVGGHAVSFIPGPILQHNPGVDAVICGEGEHVVRELVDALARGADWRDFPGLATRSALGDLRRRPPARLRSLDAVTWPARDLVPDLLAHDGLICISSSRGCQARCAFCSVPRFYGLEADRPMASGGWLGRSVAGVIDEIEDLYDRFGLLELLIVDDEFFGGCKDGHARALDFARELRSRKLPTRFALSARAENIDAGVLGALQRAGLAHVFVGLEAGTGEDLKFYAKGHSVAQNACAVKTIKELGLSFQPGFMLFNPRSDLPRLQENIAFLAAIGELKPVTINSALDPHFGAPITRVFEREGVLDGDELALHARWADPRVACAREVAEMANVAFQPHMNLIAALQSSITWEWRRKVPGRRAESQEIIDAFEKLVNRGFTNVVIHAVEMLKCGDGVEHALEQAGIDLEELDERLQIPRALVLAHVEAQEGGVRYWRQVDLIGDRLREAV